MSNENEEFNENDEDSNLVKDLRKQLDAAKKAAKEAEERAAKADAKDRSDAIAKVIQSKTEKATLAKFYPADADSSEEAVLSWLTENADVFGIDLGGDEHDEATVQAAARVSQATASAQQVKIGSPEAALEAIKNAKTYEEYQAAMAAAGARKAGS